MLEVPAIRIQQKDMTMFVTVLSLAEIKKRASVDRWGPDNAEGYQRPPVERHVRDVAKYVTQEAAVLPTSILLCVRETDLNRPTFESHGEVGSFAETGMLKIPEDATLWIADGQHRFFGVSRAYEKGNNLADYPFPVTIMTGVDQYAEMEHFNIVNTTQKKMPTDIVDRHLVAKRNKVGIDLVARGKKGEKEYQRARATQVADALNDQTGPWLDQIAIPGIVGRSEGLVRQHAVVASLEPVFRDPWLTARPEGELSQLVGRYWRALNDVWPEAFQSPSDHRVQATVGLYSLHMVLPTVVHLCLGEGDFSEAKIQEIWEETGITSNFWHKEFGDTLILGTGMASIRALAQYFREQLPKARTVTI